MDFGNKNEHGTTKFKSTTKILALSLMTEMGKSICCKFCQPADYLYYGYMNLPNGQKNL